MKLEQAVANEKLKCREKFKTLYNELQLEFISNIMYVTCTERRKTEFEKSEIKKKRDEKIEATLERLDEVLTALPKTEMENQELRQSIEDREAAMFHIIKQFQKFLYYCVKSEPMQAEYLLNIGNLMVYEFAKTHSENESVTNSNVYYFFTTRCHLSCCILIWRQI